MLGPADDAVRIGPFLSVFKYNTLFSSHKFQMHVGLLTTIVSKCNHMMRVFNRRFIKITKESL